MTNNPNVALWHLNESTLRWDFVENIPSANISHGYYQTQTSRGNGYYNADYRVPS
jgi:hypothetical protein